SILMKRSSETGMRSGGRALTMPIARQQTIMHARAWRRAAMRVAIANSPIASRIDKPHVRPAMYAISGNAAGASDGTLERSERFYVMRVGEEIDEVERGEAPAGRDQPIRVARKGYRIAGEITNHLARANGNRVDDRLPRSGARRIEEDEVGARNIES